MTMMLVTQYHFRTHKGFNSSDTDRYTLFLTEDMMLSVAGFSYIGRGRKKNEDNYILQDGTLVVVDGMDSDNLGEIASDLVCNTFEAQNDPTALPTAHQELSDTIREAHQQLIKESKTRPKELGEKDEGDLGAAASALRFRQDTVSRASVGDSRIYRLRNNKLEQLTEDDTASWEKFRSGTIPKDYIRRDQNRNFLTRYLGDEYDPLSDLQDVSDTVKIGDIYLLCTDGLWSELPDLEIERILKQGYIDHPDDDLTVAQTLVAAADIAGGRDNMTAVIARTKGIPVEILVERGMGAIEENDTSLLVDLFRKHDIRLRLAKGSKARYVLAEHAMRTSPELAHTARDLYLEVLERASPEEREEPYIGKTLDALLGIYSSLYVRETGAPNGREQTFFSKVLELRGKVKGHEKKSTAMLCDAMERIADRVVPDYQSAPTALAGIHRIVDSHLAAIPELENSFIDMYNRLAEKALEAKDYGAAYTLSKRISAQHLEGDTFRASLLGRREALIVEVARGYFEQGDTEHLRELAQREKVPATFYDWGKSAFMARHFDAAAAAFSAVAAQEPRNSWAQYYLGLTHHASGRATPAEAAFTRAIELRPAFATKDLEEASAFIAAKDYRRAGWAAERAVQVASYSDAAPRDRILETLITLGVVYKEGKETGRDHAVARRLFTSALSLDSSHIHAEYHLGTLAFMEKDYDTAEQHFEQVIRRSPKHRWAHYQLGRVHELTGNSEAKNHYQRAADLGLEQAATALKQLQK